MLSTPRRIGIGLFGGPEDAAITEPPTPTPREDAGEETAIAADAAPTGGKQAASSQMHAPPPPAAAAAAAPVASKPKTRAATSGVAAAAVADPVGFLPTALPETVAPDHGFTVLQFNLLAVSVAQQLLLNALPLNRVQ